MYRKIMLFAAAIAAVAVVPGCGLRKDRTAGREPVPVKVVVVESRPSAGVKSYVGTVRPSKSAVISCRYSGTLSELNVSEGDFVRKGDVVAVVESQTVKSTWEMAHASLRQAEDGYSRLMQVYGKGGVADVKMVEVETQLSKARASAAAADKALEDCRIKAPFDGVAGDVSAEQGVEVSAMAPLVRLLDISSVEVEISVPESEIAGMSINDRAVVSVPALGEIRFPAVLDSKGVSASPVSHTYACSMAPEAKVPGLMPGMVCKVTFEDESHALCVPASVIRSDSDGRYVWVVENGKVEKRHISSGGFSGKDVVVTSGLAEGDAVICEGIQKVSSGMYVTVSGYQEQ